MTVSLDTWHLDLLEFLDLQTENGDPRRKAYDIFPQLVVSDEFMRRVLSDSSWTLVDPYEVEQKLDIKLPELWGEDFEIAYKRVEASVGNELTLYKKVQAKPLFKQIMRTQLETGMPYLWFKDTVNQSNPNQHDGYIPCGNLCQESYSNVEPNKYAHTCNLVSVNLATVEAHELEDICRISVRLLDNTIDLTSPPFIDSANHNDRYRTIGVGCMGLADWLAKHKKNYTNLPEISELFEDFGYYCTRASVDLAMERGVYPAFYGSEWSKGNLIGAKPVQWFFENAKHRERFMQLYKDVKKYGIRNSHITAIAPNTSSSLVQGCTASVLPVFSKFFYDQWAKGTVPIAPPFIQDSFWYYPENKTMDQAKVVDAIATIQQWIDTGISMELMFNLNEGIYFNGESNRSISAVEIFNVLIRAWEKGCKAVYYIRTVQKDNFKESGDGCVSCAN